MSRRVSYGRMLVLATAMCAIWVLGAGAAAAVASPVSVGRSGWLWGDPVPQGETLDGVAFQGARGYAVGENGVVLRSDDGGAGWVGLASGTQSGLSLLQEVDPATVVVGGGCTVRESTDSGATFHRMPINESEQACASKVASFSFLSPSTGYIELADGSVLFTKDGGQSVEPKTKVPLGGAGAVQIEFVSPTIGLAVVSGGEGARVYRTADGGGSWTQVQSGKQALSAVTFVTPTLAYAVGAGKTMLASEDAGVTWAERPLKLAPVESSLAFRQISCGDANDCVILTAPAAAGGANQLVRTADGGQTGTLVTPADRNLLGLAFAGPASVVGVGEGGTTVLSPDGGATFPNSISHHLGLEFSDRLRLGASPQDAYAAAKAGQMIATTDGGARWSVLRVPTSSDLADVAFPSAEIGYAVSSAGTLYRTATAGLTWSILGSGGEAPAALVAPSVSTVLAVGPTGLRRSSDSGASFAPVGGSVVLGRRHHRVVRRSLSGFPLFAGAELAGSAVIAWGDEAIESLDGGAHWTLIPRPLANGNVEAVSFLTPRAGYEVSRQRLFFTRNAGRKWTEISSLGTPALGGEGMLSFSNAQDGYALTAVSAHHDVLLRTTDGGRSWMPEALPRHLLSVAADGAVDYAVGEGALFATTDGGRSTGSSTMTLGISGSHRLSRARLKKAHGRVRLAGRLSPAQGGELVRVAFRRVGRAVWQGRSARVASNGSFSLTVSGVSASTDFVAQWNGEGPVGGAGTPAVRLTVTRR